MIKDRIISFMILIGCAFMGKLLHRADPDSSWDKALGPCSDTIH